MTPFLARLPEFETRTVLDVLLVALLIYEFLKLIRGTRATPMLLGVFVLAAAFIAARFAQLRTLGLISSADD